MVGRCSGRLSGVWRGGTTCNDLLLLGGMGVLLLLVVSGIEVVLWR